MAAELNWRAIAAKIIYQAYPDSDLLPVDPPMAGETIGNFAVRAEGAGDTLFLFLCREANDDLDVEEYRNRLFCAVRDIEQVYDAFTGLPGDAPPSLPPSEDQLP